MSIIVDDHAVSQEDHGIKSLTVSDIDLSSETARQDLLLLASGAANPTAKQCDDLKCADFVCSWF